MSGLDSNIILVHGAWADGSSWSHVIPFLLSRGFKTVAVQLSLHSLAEDAATVKRAIARTSGPVMLVGHSYGGAVITEAGNDFRVTGLVYVAAFAPDTGESLGELGKEFPPPPGVSALSLDESGFLTLSTDAYLENFAPDVPLTQRKILAATQGPAAAAAFGARISHAAWHDKPSWYVVAKDDRMIDPEFELVMARRINARLTRTLAASHAVMHSRADEVAAFIVEAAAKCL